MTTFTDEDKELIKEIRERIGSLDVRDNIERRAYEIALASLEAEAVCVIDQSNLDYLEAGYDADVWPVSRAEMADVFLYRAVPPVPDKIALAIENLKQKLVECNRYNYCADAVKGVEDAYLAAMRHGPEPVSQTCKLPPMSSNEVNDATWKLLNMLTEHGPLNGRQFNNLKGCFYEALKVAMRNSPVTPDSWISCSERMPDTKTAVLVAREFDRKGDWRMKWATYIPGHPDANDGWIIPGASWKPSHWMPLPEPPL